ncbi:MAG: FadR family transcriptional regulator [Firmicutes bacterium]|nr:FadR family transcriptional regulator [Bacillota bacterium]
MKGELGLSTIKRDKVSSLVLEEIRLYIERQELEEGSQLPSERQLARSLGVSRTSIREAMKVLQGEGLIEIRVGQGTFLRSREHWLDSASGHLKAKETLLETLEVRQHLEELAVELVIKYASDEELDLVEEALLQIEKVRASGKDASEEDWEFHNRLYRCCKNRVLIRVIDEILGLLREFWNKPFGRQDFAEESNLYHREMFEAIRRRDVREAKRQVSKIVGILRRDIMEA